ncbi:RHS repeat domain-containing protein [Tunturibacter empetritectus]|uniref:RHS repeat-associated protein n=1 Tax=Tunturiibacter lichenicola TaxID=2051959 RepID=A0A7W8JB05_9BACT|nr:RHS repeat-associated core domain-containing protein [Edaphobacter lichenicola]MBB5345865.1 RHS repeat-associated protein [Edaphobacter lichenicola]
MNRILLVLCVILLLVCPMAFAQNLGTGLYPFGSFDSRGFDSINLGNLNTHFEVPIVSKPGRGLSFAYSLVYDGLIWSPSTTTGTQTWVADPNWGFHGQLLGGAAYNGYLTYSSLSTPCPPVGSRSIQGNLYTNYVYHDPYGKNHRFNYSLKSCPLTDPGNGTVTGNGSSSDGSGLTYNLSDFKVHTRNGTIINAPTYSGPGSPSNGSITDSNGNVITNNGNGTFTDTTGNTALTVGGSGTPASPTTFTYPVVEQANGASTAAATLAYKAYTVQTNFQCSGITEFGATSVNLVDHISLADGSTYSFTYEATPGVNGAFTGRLASITLPTGGTITYTYTNGCNGSGINSDSTVGGLIRTTSDGARTYSRIAINSNATTTKVQDEKGNQSSYSFSYIGPVFYETHRQIYQGSVGGAALLEQFTCYNGATPPCDGAAMALPITQTSTLLNYNGSLQLGTTNVYDASGMLTSSTLKNGTSTLESITNSYNSLEELKDSTSKDQKGTPFAFSYYGYDEATATATSAIPQHVAASGTRGNQTSAHVSAGATYLVTTTTYYDTGVPITVTTPNGTTRYGYESTQTFANSTTLPTPSSGIALATAAGFDANSGAALSSTDLNTQTTQATQYDALLRPTIITPPSAAGGQVTISYSPTQTGVNQAMGNGQSTSTQTLLDAYGRKSRVAVYNGQSSNTWYQTDYCYDATGLLQFQSVQYQSTGFVAPKQCSGNGTSYVYDALGRVTSSANSDGTSSTDYLGRAVHTTDVNGIQKITQYDLLGRISGVCEITAKTAPGSPAPAACSMDYYGVGYVTSYMYSLASHTTTVIQGVQQRTFITDSAGRTVSITEPERGITTYSYAYNSTGLQVTRQRPQANQINAGTLTTTTTQYDSLGRVVSISYNDSLTPNKTYNYDSPLGWNFTQSNIKGQMTAAIATNNTASAFSYDSMGRMTAIQACEPSTCGNASASRPGRTFGYDLVGNITSTFDGASGTISYTRSPAGEVTSVTNQSYTGTGNPPNLVSNVVNGPYGPSSYSMGNGLCATRYYDGLGRNTQGYVLSGASQPGCTNGTQVYGFLMNYKGSQAPSTCDTVTNPCSTYSYDEFNRVASRTQGTNFTYTYDLYGNRTQQTLTQGGPAPSPSYTVNAANNQIQQAGFVYDAAGNLTNDTVHTYTYDAEGNLLKVDGGSSAYVYDALNRRVRQQTASGTYEYLYDPAGRRTSRWNVSNNSGDEGRIYWDGKQIAFRAYDGTTYFEHQDWMGTERVRTNYLGAVASSYPSLPWGDGFTSPSTPPYSNQDTLQYAQLDHDSESGTEHAQFRQYSSTWGRWMSPDPYDGSYSINPQSLNRYSYVLNNPLGLIDPSGQLCSVVVGGIEQSPNTPSTTAQQQFASRIGAIQAFPYAGGGVVGGALDVLAQANLNTNASYVAAAAFTAAAQSGPFNIFTFSGGAQATMNALNLVSPQVRGLVNNITMLSPGVAAPSTPLGAFPVGTGNTTVLLGNSFLDSIAAGGAAGTGFTGCGHVANCAFTNNNALLHRLAGGGSGCNTKAVFTPRGTLGGTQIDSSNWSYAYFFVGGFADDGATVTSTEVDNVPSNPN